MTTVFCCNVNGAQENKYSENHSTVIIDTVNIIFPTFNDILWVIPLLTVKSLSIKSTSLKKWNLRYVVIINH